MSWLRPKRADGAAKDEPRAGEFEARRRTMIDRHLVARGIQDAAVLRAMGRVPREEFVARRLRRQAYDDNPLTIGHGQTVSQPYVVARTIELARVGPGRRVLEIGVGCGYQAAVLAEMGAEVYGLEIVPELEREARRRLDRLGYGAVQTRAGDGFDGWIETAPFDAIVLAAAPERLPPPLLAQLAEGGRLVGPVGPSQAQVLTLVRREGDEYPGEKIFPVRFVSMTGRAEEERRQ